MTDGFRKLVPLTDFQIEPAGETLARALQEYPVFIQALPDAAERKANETACSESRRNRHPDHSGGG